MAKTCKESAFSFFGCCEPLNGFSFLSNPYNWKKSLNLMKIQNKKKNQIKNKNKNKQNNNKDDNK